MARALLNYSTLVFYSALIFFTLYNDIQEAVAQLHEEEEDKTGLTESSTKEVHTSQTPPISPVIKKTKSQSAILAGSIITKRKRYVCMYVCMYVNMYVCMYVCMYMYVYNVYVCITGYTCIYMFICMYLYLISVTAINKPLSSSSPKKSPSPTSDASTIDEHKVEEDQMKLLTDVSEVICY